MNKEQVIPKATAKRLPLYYRYLKFLEASGKTKVSSTELSEAVRVDSATIRRDFSYFGELGKRGYGYDIPALLSFFKKILREDQLTQVGLVGVGNLGNALLKYQFHKNNNIRISAAFDIKEDIIGRVVDGVPVYRIHDLKEQIHIHQIEIVILTVPPEHAQEVTDLLVEAGVKGIMNFTPIRIATPKSVHVQSVDLTNELQTLIYFLNHY